VKPENLAGNRHDQQVAITRFEREAQVTASLRSAHTVQLYDFGVARTEAFFYVMELLNGLDLDELVMRFGPVSPSRAVYFLHQVCDSLGEAHEQGLTHRDIKPGNIYVVGTGGR
jgi:serine/threonine-protein kinase